MISIVLMPLVGALIGWFTNYLAIKMLFRPLAPVKFLGIIFQGLIPRRRDEIAKSIGEAVEKELLSVDDLLDQIASPALQQEVVAAIVEVSSRKLHEKMAIIPTAVRNFIVNYLQEIIEEEAKDAVAELKERISESIKAQVHLASLVEEKLKGFEPAELERIILSLSSRELKHIEVLGGILGLIIGLLQAGFAYFFPLP